METVFCTPHQLAYLVMKTEAWLFVINYINIWQSTATNWKIITFNSRNLNLKQTKCMWRRKHGTMSGKRSLRGRCRLQRKIKNPLKRSMFLQSWICWNDLLWFSQRHFYLMWMSSPCQPNRMSEIYIPNLFQIDEPYQPLLLSYWQSHFAILFHNERRLKRN